MCPEVKKLLDYIHTVAKGTSKMVPCIPICDQIKKEFPESDIDEILNWVITKKYVNYQSGQGPFWLDQPILEIGPELIGLSPDGFEALKIKNISGVK